MTNQQLVECIKRAYLDVLRDDANALEMMATFAYIGALMEDADVDSTTIDISDFKNGKYSEVYEDFQNAVIKFIENYK